MGFLDKLLSRETRKIIDNVVDRVTDVVKDAVSDSTGSATVQTTTTGTTGQTASALDHSTANTPAKNAATSVGETDCCHDAALVSRRIQAIIAENFNGCELRKEVSSSEIGATDISWQYTYGVYRNGRAVAMINLLDNPNDYRRKIVLQSKQACKDHGVGYVHFLLHLPNRGSYILEQLTKIIPA